MSKGCEQHVIGRMKCILKVSQERSWKSTMFWNMNVRQKGKQVYLASYFLINYSYTTEPIWVGLAKNGVLKRGVTLVHAS